jgi:4-amino-4-deoxy-L-arabinose transferase-like glycosyltransferase
LLAILLLLVGFGLRLYDLTDQPIDFHPTRQLRGAILARSLYYQMAPGIDAAAVQKAVDNQKALGQYEPPILEALVALTYLAAGGEYLWIANIYSALLWIIGGVFLFDLARRMTSPPGAILALGYYLVLPFAVQASRSFQPDPAMVMWIILAFYALYRWGEAPTWKWAVLAGLFGGAAVLTKIMALFILAVVASVVVLTSLGFRRFWRSPQVWVMLILMVLPPAIYYLGSQGYVSDYLEDRTVTFGQLLLSPGFYMRWLSLAQDLVGLGAILLGLIGVVISRPRNRLFLAGMWAGYLVYGLFFNYYMYTHSYYHLQLVPVIGLSLAPVGELIYTRVRQQSKAWQVVFAGAILVGVFYLSAVPVTERNATDYRQEPAYWQGIAANLPGDGRIIALTQDYGLRLTYYGGQNISLWPPRGERQLSGLRGQNKAFEEYFAGKTEGKDYFLITAFKQLEDQPDLKSYLKENYPLIADESGYMLYDLANPLK